MLEGVVNCKKPTFNVNISNFEEVPVTVQKGAKIGFIWAATKVQKPKKDNKILTAMERIERIKFITEKLNIASNPLIENVADQRKLINMFLANYDCISTSTNDIGYTELHKFDFIIPCH